MHKLPWLISFTFVFNLYLQSNRNHMRLTCNMYFPFKDSFESLEIALYIIHITDKV